MENQKLPLQTPGPVTLWTMLSTKTTTRPRVVSFPLLPIDIKPIDTFVTGTTKPPFATRGTKSSVQLSRNAANEANGKLI